MKMNHSTQQQAPALPYAFEPPISGKAVSSSGQKTLPEFFNHVTPRNMQFLSIGVTALALLLIAAGHGTGFGTAIASGVVLYFISQANFRNSKVMSIATGVVGLLLLPILWNTFTFLFLFVALFSSVTGFMRAKNGSYNFSTSEAGLASMQDSMRSVWGVAGGHIGNNTAFGSAGQAGAKGEIIVGRMLNEIVDEFPFVRVFNGVRFTPGKDGADIDHVVLIGNKVFFVDAKNWSFGNYSWSGDTVLRDGSPFLGGEVHMDGALNKWIPFLHRSATVTSRITLAKYENSQYHYGVNNNYAPNGVWLSTLAQLNQELRQTAMSSAPVVNRHLVWLFAKELQS